MSEYEDESSARHIGAAHQLSPPVPWYRKRWILWSSLLFLLLLGVIVFVAIHINDAKAAAAKRALAAVKPSVTAAVATAAKGNIGTPLRSTRAMRWKGWSNSTSTRCLLASKTGSPYKGPYIDQSADS